MPHSVSLWICHINTVYDNTQERFFSLMKSWCLWTYNRFKKNNFFFFLFCFLLLYKDFFINIMVKVEKSSWLGWTKFLLSSKILQNASWFLHHYLYINCTPFLIKFALYCSFVTVITIVILCLEVNSIWNGHVWYKSFVTQCCLDALVSFFPVQLSSQETWAPSFLLQIMFSNTFPIIQGI